MTRKWLAKTVLAIFLLCFSTTLAWTLEEVTIKNFLVEEGVSVSISNIQGKVAVEGHRENIVNMTASKSVKDLPQEKAQELLGQVAVKTEVAENALRITTDPLDVAGNSSTFSWSLPQVNYLLAVPYGAKVNLETISGVIKVTDLQNEVKTKTVSGKTLAQGLSGKSSLESISGEIQVERLRGDLFVQTVSGKITVTIPLSEEPLEIQISTVSGDVSIFVHEREGIQLAVETLSGWFSSEIPLEITRVSSLGWQSLKGRSIFEPRKKILVKTISGNISIKKLGTDL